MEVQTPHIVSMDSPMVVGDGDEGSKGTSLQPSEDGGISSAFTGTGVVEPQFFLSYMAGVEQLLSKWFGFSYAAFSQIFWLERT